MKEFDVIEYNMLCAEFMGLKHGWWEHQQKPLTDDKKQWWDIDGKTFLGTRVYYTNQLLFESDWNWIHGLVEQINLTQSPIKNKADTTHSTLKYEIRTFLGKSLKKSTVKAIWQFLNWYKENK